MWFDFNAGYLSINKDLLKVTSEHEFWVLNKSVEPENEYMPPIDRWGFKKAAGLKVGDVLFGKNELIEIESIEWNHTEVEVVNINVEPVDVYFVNNILVKYVIIIIRKIFINNLLFCNFVSFYL